MVMDVKEEIRARLNIVDVIGEYVQLKRAGRSYKGISPFTDEKTPSFFVSPEKQIWHCFSTNKGGDLFSFVMEVEGLDFKGALEMLARKAGVDMSLYQRGDGSFAKKREKLGQATELAAKFFQQAMVQSKTAQEYIFKKRGLSKEVVQAFGIGYAPDSFEFLTKLLIKRGYASQELIDAGLSVRRRTLSDLFRGRMMVPLRDPQGRALGFTGRIIGDVPNAPKYLNTPQTILYDKSRHVFGLDLAKDAIRQHDYAVIVEGNLDVVSSHQVGVKQVVATAGTALTEHHLRTISRFTPNIRLCFDADKAGIAATERAIPIAQQVGVRLSIITLPKGFKDADELIQHDPKQWQAAIEAPRDVVEWVIDEYAKRVDVATADGKATVSTKALAVIRAISDPVQTEHYLGYLAKVLKASTTALQSKLSQQPAAEKPSLRPSQAKPTKPDDTAYQDLFLALNAAFPEVRESLKRVNGDDLATEQRRWLFAVLQQLGQQRITTETISQSEELRKDETYVKIILFTAEERYGARQWNGTSLYHEALGLAARIQNDTKKRKQALLRSEIQAAYERQDMTEVERLQKAYQSLVTKTKE